MRSVPSNEDQRVATDLPAWFVNDLTLDPNSPTIVYATTGGHGIGAFEVMNDLAVSISGHCGAKPKGLSSSFDVSVSPLLLLLRLPPRVPVVVVAAERWII